MKYYLDSCIWLNLFKKEGDSRKGKPYWQIARDFIETCAEKEIACSGFILREIESKIKDRQAFTEKRHFLANTVFIKAKAEDYAFARKLESEVSYELSFYDCLHIAICKRLNLTLVTRDKDLIKLARIYVIAEKPENLIV